MPALAMAASNQVQAIKRADDVDVDQLKSMAGYSSVRTLDPWEASLIRRVRRISVDEREALDKYLDGLLSPEGPA